METGKLTRAILAPLVLLNLFMFCVVLGLSGWMLNRSIELRAYGGMEANIIFRQGDFGGNASTPYFALFSLIAGMVGVASAITGMHHVRVGSSSSAAAAQATSWITWLLLVVAFCLAWKEIHIGGRNLRHKVLEAFIIILTPFKFAETLAYYIHDKSPDNSAL